MHTYQAVPAFGKPLRTPEYFSMIDSILAVLRPMSTLRTCAIHLNGLGLTTPAGKQWCRIGVANYLRNRQLRALKASTDDNSTN